MKKPTIIDVIRDKAKFSMIPEVDLELFMCEFDRRLKTAGYKVPPVIQLRYKDYIKGTPWSKDRYQYLRTFQYLPPDALYDYYVTMRTFPSRAADSIKWNTDRPYPLPTLNEYLEYLEGRGL